MATATRDGPQRGTFRAMIRFVFRQPQQRLLLLLGSVAVVLTTAIVSLREPTWWPPVESILGVTTTFVALAIWIGERKEAWERSLPRKITVRFVFEDKEKNRYEVLRCEEAHLANEADVRPWAQQIGAQMLGEAAGKARGDLSIYPGDIETVSEIRRSPEGEFYKHIDATFRLREPPLALFRDCDGTRVFFRRLLWNDDNRFSSKGSTTELIEIPKDQLPEEYVRRAAEAKENEATTRNS